MTDPVPPEPAGPVDFQALAREAQETTYNPRPNGRCWVFFHDWSMWEPAAIIGDVGSQHRRCLRCGRIQKNVVNKGVHSEHRWETTNKITLVEGEHELPRGMLFIQRCNICGDIRRHKIMY